MKVVIFAILAASLVWPTPGLAGSGRQSDTIEVDYGYRAVSRWLERNEQAVEESTGAQVIQTTGNLVTLQKQTKRGLQVFRLRREGNGGIYRGTFVDRSAGELTDYTYQIKLSPISNGRTQIDVTMTATTEQSYSVSVNVELRKSIRGLRTFLQEHLLKQAP
jgi:hypothetical protein